VIHDRQFAQLTTGELYAILALRAEVFVVEQECAYLDLDGRDAEPATHHVWVGEPVDAYLRVLDDGGARRIGRVVTRPRARATGLAGRLVDHALATTEGPWVLDAQSHLTGWYARFGFAVAGPEFLEDGIPHTPMHRGS